LDIVGVNEAHGWSYPESANQVAMLGRLLNMNWLYAPAERRWYCREFGNGLLSSLPTDRWERIPLPGKFATSGRNMVLVRTGCQSRTVRILLTHLIRNEDTLRQQQFQRAASLFLSLEAPAVLAGDLNMDGSHPQMRKLLAAPGVVDALSAMRLPEENQGVDWVLVRGLRVVEAGIREEGASDHPLVWASLALPAASEGRATEGVIERGMAAPARKRLQ
jgi:endonuclease/exonuclease/phosphatase family metal-dependent hydrolase